MEVGQNRQMNNRLLVSSNQKSIHKTTNNEKILNFKNFKGVFWTPTETLIFSQKSQGPNKLI